MNNEEMFDVPLVVKEAYQLSLLRNHNYAYSNLNRIPTTVSAQKLMFFIENNCTLKNGNKIKFGNNVTVSYDITHFKTSKEILLAY